MRQFNVTGMSCAACSSRVEKAVSKLDGVTSCSVSLLTNSMGVEGNVSDDTIIAAVQNAGYGASVKGTETAGASIQREAAEEALEDHDTPVLKKRLFASLGFLIILMYFSMGHMMWGWPLPHFYDNNHLAMGLTQLLLTVIIMVINQKFFISGFKSLWHRAPNMDTLVALGSSAAFLYSTFALFEMTAAQAAGDDAAVMHYMMEFYFESAAMILTLITVGKMLEAHSKGKTTDALKSLMRLAPKKANVIRDGNEVEIPIEQVKMGDVFVVRPGESIPVDGVVLEGNSAVNEAALTGESIPVDKAAGDEVSAATMNQSGLLRCEAVRVGEDTTLQQIIQMVSDAAATKAPIAKIADKVSGVFVPVVISIAVITTIVWLLAGQSVGFALARGISVLVISCPCALGLATPVAIMVGNGLGAKNGILFKTAASLEATGRTQIVALDKTGTITIGNRKATRFHPADGIAPKAFVRMCVLSSVADPTPEGKSVVELGAAEGVRTDPVTMVGVRMVKFTAETKCSGVDMPDGRRIRKGAAEAIFRIAAEHENPCPAGIAATVRTISENGGTPLVVCENERITGVIELQDIIKTGIREHFERLRRMGVKTVMVTGDNPLTAKYIAEKAGVDDFIAEARPEDKLEYIRREQQSGKLVAMMGDGTNDAPALAQADVGVAMNSGTQAAKEAGNMVDLDNDPTKLIEIVEIGKQLLMTRGTLTTFSIANDVAKYFAIVPALFIASIPSLGALNVMHLHSPESAILSAVIFNALIIPLLIPLALRGVTYKPIGASALLRRNLFIYGLGGVIVPFVGIKLIDMLISVFF